MTTGATQLIGGRYRSLELIGRGGMGDVYRGQDTYCDDDLVAIKALKESVTADDPDLLERFSREGQALRQLNHPNIVTMLDSIQENERHYLIMEYVGGGSLRDVLDEGLLLPIGRVLEIALDLADALTRAHRLNIIHRDIKPGNVLIAADGTPRLTDFGVAWMGGRSRVTETGTLVGTFAYLSPEACRGDVVDARTDIWSFGVLLYELLTGVNPFKREQAVATINAIVNDSPPPIKQYRPEVPDVVSDLIGQMLTPDRETRIRSVRLVGAELEDIIRMEDTPLKHTLGSVVKRLPENEKSRFATPTPPKPPPPPNSPPPNFRPTPANDELPEPSFADGEMPSGMLSQKSAQNDDADCANAKPEVIIARKIQDGLEHFKQMDTHSWIQVIENEDGSEYVKVGPIEVKRSSEGKESVKIGHFFHVENDKAEKGHKASHWEWHTPPKPPKRKNEVKAKHKAKAAPQVAFKIPPQVFFLFIFFMFFLTCLLPCALVLKAT